MPAGYDRRTVAVGSVPSDVHRLSAGEYRRLVDAGVFDEDARIELIDGVLVDMSPKTRAHEKAIVWLSRLVMTSIDLGRFDVRIAAPLTLGDSEPEPDLAIVEHGTPEPNHPASAALVVEVAASSHRRDLVEKPPIYAAAGVPRYWVVDLDGRRAVVHAVAREGRYADVRVLGRDGTLEAAELGLPPVPVAELVAAAER